MKAVGQGRFTCYDFGMKKLAMILVFAAGPAAADITYPSGKTVECYCTDRTGSRIELGETICMQVDGRMFMAQCQMSLNNPMWREVQEGCLSSRLQSVQPSLDPVLVDARI